MLTLELKPHKAELAVHKRKVEDVRRWLLEAFEGGPSGKLRKYRVRACRWRSLQLNVSTMSLQRILALTGPAGTAKTSTLRVLSRELNSEILEWRNSMSERGPSAFQSDGPLPDGKNCTDQVFYVIVHFFSQVISPRKPCLTNSRLF